VTCISRCWSRRTYYVRKQKEINTGKNIDKLFATAYPLLKSKVSVPAAPHNIGIALGDGSMHVVISKNSIVPTRKTVSFSSAEEQSLFLQIYEGEDTLAQNNKLLAR
jgi:molecular chaperone DnaK (HSP70)